MQTRRNRNPSKDVVLIGAGIMSATLGTLLKELNPDLTIHIYERLDTAAAESSDAWNNAGTGHSAFCELNYTPELPNGKIDTSKAISIAESFEISKQFWAYLIENKLITLPNSFIRSIPHMSFVWGEENVTYLTKRYEALKKCHLFREMEFSTDKETIEKWIPLVMAQRDASEKVAATKMDLGTDVNFGALTRCLFNRLKDLPGVALHFNHEVKDLKKAGKKWKMKIKDHDSGDTKEEIGKFVFIGAGGGALPLLLKSGIPEGKGYGGFPVSGQWLRCTNRSIIEKHNAKVYGKAAVGSPPMSVPHLDTRWIKGKRELLFGPFAGFSTKFLKHGSLMDLPRSIRFNNIRPMLAAGIHNIPLTRYLIEQVRLSPEDRIEALKEYYPEAALSDWELEVAGQRVQIIKSDPEEGGILEFGTEIVSSSDGTLAALLGASPGASTAVTIMLNLMTRCFSRQMKQEVWKAKLKEMIPSLGQSLAKDAKLCFETRQRTSKVLGLVPPAKEEMAARTVQPSA